MSKVNAGIRKASASCLYTGYFPIASGTVGSFAAVLFGMALAVAAGYSAAGLALLLSVPLLLWVGTPLGTWAEDYYGKKDPSPFVFDELAGSFLTLGVLLVVFPKVSLVLLAAAAFFSFRFFDIAKIFPANKAEEIPGGLGIMLDDLIAGAYAAAASVVGLLAYLKYMGQA